MGDKGMRLEELTVYGSKDAVIQNLEDAGCAPDMVECCVACMEQGKKEELLQRLGDHRKGLLHRVHEEEKHIDCLDYLVCQIRRCEELEHETRKETENLKIRKENVYG